MIRLVFFGFVALTLIVGNVAAQDDILRVDATQDLGEISPYVYGANSDFNSVVPPDLMPQAQALGITYLRLGSTLSDSQDLRESNIDFLVYQARQMSAEPAITVRLLGGSPEQAADLVRYANVEKGYNIRFWSIGNEPSFFVKVLHAPSYTTEDLNREWRAIAEAMKEVDPTIQLVGPDISQYVVLNADEGNMQYVENSGGGEPRDKLGRDWMQEFLRANGDLVDVVSIHRYPYPGLGGGSHEPATIEGLRGNIAEWDTSIPNLRRVIREAAGRDIPIAVTELNSNSVPNNGGEAGTDSLFNAIWLADVLGRLIRQQVYIVAYWQLRSQLNGFGLLSTYDPRPTYYVYILYKQFGSELIAAESSDADISIYASKREDGTLTLMVVNLGTDEKTKSLQFTGFTPSGDAEVWRLDEAHNAEQLEAQNINKAITIPRQSVTLYVIPGN